MVRRLGLFLLTLCGLAAAHSGANAAPEERNSELLHCDDWFAARLPPGVVGLELLQVLYVDDPEGIAGFFRIEDEWVPGQFHLSRLGRTTPIAVWRAIPPPDPEADTSKLVFTTRVGHSRAIFVGELVSYQTGYGWLEVPPDGFIFDYDIPDEESVTCTVGARGDLVAATSDGKQIEPDAKSGIVKNLEKAGKEAEKEGRPDEPKQDIEAKLKKKADSSGKEIADLAAADPTANLDLRKTDGGGAPKTGGADVATTEDPGKTPSPVPPKACRFDDLAAGVAMPLDAGIGSYTVGLRNDDGKARVFKYVEALNETVVSNFIADLATSTGRYLVYDPVMAATSVKLEDGTSADVLPVTVSGVDESMVKPLDPEAAKPASTLKLVVVGAPEEMSISGLDLVGAELTKQSKGQIGLAIEWYGIGADSKLAAPETFDSFESLIKAATERATRDDRGDPVMIVLNEGQFAAFIADFQRTMTSRTGSVDRVVWVKGAYGLASDAPKLLEAFISAVSGSSAIPHAPNGEPERWLIAVTARMSGFSLGYLKEPVSDLKAGEVIDEKDRAVGHFIADPAGVAVRLKSLGEMRARAAGKTVAAGGTPAAPAGGIVLDANQIFSERGYVVSPAAVAALVNRLIQLNAVLENPADPVGMEILAKEAGKPSPAIADLLQADVLAGFRLPKDPLIRKGLADLTDDERPLARGFVSEFLAAATKLASIGIGGMQDKPDLGCTLVYVPESALIPAVKSN